MPKPIQPSATIQPKELPKHCVNTDEESIRVIAAGTGQKFPKEDFDEMDGLLRQTTFSTFARYNYGRILFGRNDFHPPSVILAQSSTASDVGGGDSGLINLKRIKVK